MEAGTIIALVAAGLTLAGFLALHVFRGPNVQHQDLRDELKSVRADMSDIRRDQDQLERAVNALDKRLSADHLTKGEIKEMLTEIRGQVGMLTTMVTDLNMAVALIRGGNVRQS